MKHILIVDDEKLIRYSLSAAFQGKDAETMTAPDGSGALAALGNWSFDFCFLDVQLPDMSGIDLMTTIRRVSPRTKIIMMTGSEVDEAVMKAISDNAYLFLTKPFDLFRVKRVLDAVPSEEKNVFQEFAELESRLAAERRRHRRRQEEPKQITYVTSLPGAEEQKQDHRADLIDISDTGTCIRTEQHLEPGSVIRFKNSVKNAAGIVRWSVNDERNQAYLAGIQFLGSDHPDDLH